MTELRQLDVRIPVDLYQRLTRLAHRNNQSRPEFLRDRLAEIAGIKPEKLVRRDYGIDGRSSHQEDWYGIGVERQRTRAAIQTLKDCEP